MKKGFTLIELLAVIVILAIIALIATPIILGIIEDARTEAKERSAELAYTGVQYAITQYMYKNNGAAPTTPAQVATYFKADNVTMNGDTITEVGAGADADFSCTVTAKSEAGNFKVTCTYDGNSLLDKTIYQTGTAE